MPKLTWFGGTEDVDQLIARGKLKRAIRIFEEQQGEDPANTVCRQQLGDVLGRAGHKERAIAVLSPLIDEFANDGFVAKAIAVIEKLERLDPERIDTAHLISKVRKQSEPAETVPLIPAHLESDTVTLEAGGAGEEDQHATSMINANWFQEMESMRPAGGWSPLLDDLPPEAFDEVVGNLHLLVKNPGAIVFGQGETAESIFLLASGFARAYRRSDEEQPYRQVLVFEEGQFFGEEALLEPWGAAAGHGHRGLGV